MKGAASREMQNCVTGSEVPSLQEQEVMLDSSVVESSEQCV